MRVIRKEGKKVNKYKVPSGERKPEIMMVTQEDIEVLEEKVKQLQHGREERIKGTMETDPGTR